MEIRPAMSMQSIDESMSQVEEVLTLDALRSHIKHRFDFWQPTDENIQFIYWGYDARIEWDTFLITVNGHAALFSDGSFDETSVDRLRRRVERNPEDKLLSEVLQDLEDYEQTFNLRWKADMRAIDRWHQAHPGRDHIWPDHADLCAWLMDQWPDTQAPIPTPGIPARSGGNSDAAISDGSADHGEALTKKVDSSRP